MPLYQRIRDLREDADKNQTEIAEYLGTTAQYYGKYEKGEREIPFSRVIQLANYYKVSLDYIAGRTNIKVISPELSLNEDELQIIKEYRNLSERNKGKAELFINQLSDLQKGNKA